MEFKAEVDKGSDGDGDRAAAELRPATVISAAIEDFWYVLTTQA